MWAEGMFRRTVLRQRALLRITVPRIAHRRRTRRRVGLRSLVRKKIVLRTTDRKKIAAKRTADKRIAVLTATAPIIRKRLTCTMTTHGSAMTADAVIRTTIWIIRGNTGDSPAVLDAVTSIASEEATAIVFGSTIGFGA